jgi:hypothetical protein
MMLNALPRILLFAVALWSATYASAKKMEMAIESVILSADLIVIGQIESDGIGSYAFSVQETLHGDTALKTIRVKKWKEWTCDSRDFKIKKGQRLLLLLGKEESDYYPINASTGEVPVRHGSIPSRNGYYDVLPRAVPVEEFSEAVRALRACCHITAVRNDFGYFYDWVWDCSPEQRSERTAKNELTAWLFDRMERREKKK